MRTRINYGRSPIEKKEQNRLFVYLLTVYSIYNRDIIIIIKLYAHALFFPLMAVPGRFRCVFVYLIDTRENKNELRNEEEEEAPAC